MNVIKLSATEKKRFNTVHAALLFWYKKNRRKFSWRKKIRDPYEVLVCEVMGQQTQASRIEEFLPRFLSKFPTLRSLASAKQSAVIKEWQGLGYNRRALNLHRAAKELYSDHSSRFPRTEEKLLALPGIGKYTARAVLIFAFNKPIATVDINIQRLLSRLYKKMPDRDAMLPQKEIFDLAEMILPIKGSRLWHEALMDFGATICTKRNPGCPACPLFDECKSGKVFIDIPESSTVPIRNNEPKYFGRPRRIWRGKVLKIIAEHEPVVADGISRNIQNSFPKSEFAVFVKTILDDLVAEGFCIKKNTTYCLLP
ncbi:MAG: A/G-specific adenine glycosylase [Candidatus Kapaibacterium sp.]